MGVTHLLAIFAFARAVFLLQAGVSMGSWTVAEIEIESLLP